jgi:hypothetical protein
MSCFSEVVRAGQGLVPRLRRSDVFGIDSQPCRAGLKFGYRPSGPRIHAICRVIPRLTCHRQVVSSHGTQGQAGGTESRLSSAAIPLKPQKGLEWGTQHLLVAPPGLKPSVCIPEHSRGFENPLPRTKSPGLAQFD